MKMKGQIKNMPKWAFIYLFFQTIMNTINDELDAK